MDEKGAAQWLHKLYQEKVKAPSPLPPPQHPPHPYPWGLTEVPQGS